MTIRHLLGTSSSRRVQASGSQLRLTILNEIGSRAPLTRDNLRRYCTAGASTYKRGSFGDDSPLLAANIWQILSSSILNAVTTWRIDRATKDTHTHTRESYARAPLAIYRDFYTGMCAYYLRHVEYPIEQQQQDIIYIFFNCYYLKKLFSW